MLCGLRFVIVRTTPQSQLPVTCDMKRDEFPHFGQTHGVKPVQAFYCLSYLRKKPMSCCSVLARNPPRSFRRPVQLVQIRRHSDKCIIGFGNGSFRLIQLLRTINMIGTIIDGRVSSSTCPLKFHLPLFRYA